MAKRKGSKAALMIMLFIGIGGIILWAALNLSDKAQETGIELPSKASRVEFLNSFGLIVDPEPEIQDIKIPYEFGEIYNAYNELQRSQGLDLEKYAGADAVLLRYKVLNCPDYPENVTANLVLCSNILIACDITLNEEGGFTKALIPESVT
ncbi:MAG: DUF4830 domain-containing protein [Oscillospiraceae bacterium]|nr:DUF4830 domain-containing protein [Oscillospiraceae bacterium]